MLKSRLLLSFLLSSAPLFVGCSPNGNGNSDGGDMTPPPDPLVRLAHYTAGAPAFDVCVKGPSDADYVGPIIAKMTPRTAGGVPYGRASAYLSLRPAAYKVRVVPGVATSCLTALGGLPDVDVDPIAAGHRYTMAGMGYLLNPTSIKLVVIEDDNTPAAGQARLRFVHASSGLSGLELGPGATGTYSKQISVGGYTEVSDVGGGKQYITTAPVNQATYSLRVGGGSTDLKTFLNGVSLAAGEVYTVTAIGVNGGTPALQLSLCDDSAQADSATGLGICSVIQ